MEDHKVLVEAAVEEFTKEAMTDHYDSGAFVSFDATGLRIEAPERFAGRHLVIFHDEELPADSPWREIGRRLRFKIRESQLTGEDTVFTGAAGELEALPPEHGAAS
jgi:hypothetical protein